MQRATRPHPVKVRPGPRAVGGGRKGNDVPAHQLGGGITAKEPRQPAVGHDEFAVAPRQADGGGSAVDQCPISGFTEPQGPVGPLPLQDALQ